MARKRKNGKQDSTQTSRIVVEYKEGVGTTVRVDKAFSAEHATWMMAQAIQILVTQGGQEDEELQELSDAPVEEEETDLPTVSE